MRKELGQVTQLDKGEKLYPRPRREKDLSPYLWMVEYDLAYDGGGSRWKGYYRAKWWAKVCAFYNVRIGSWGGTAVLRMNPLYRRKT